MLSNRFVDTSARFDMTVRPLWEKTGSTGAELVGTYRTG